ncbi:MAG TPA: hydantoinase/oxoprolinase family protein [Gemmatimonadaceae bacterium]|nr:hydantoinase/oxoprolinase family protein [Gemmatimonadaceae bacterium]
MSLLILGWDIGGVNTKVALVEGGRVVGTRAHPFELQRDPPALAPLLARAARELLGARHPDAHAVAMTAELSQYFRTKREGVAFVLRAVEEAFPGEAVRVLATDERWLSPGEARAEPLAAAASNWVATARLVAASHPDALLIDVGTTTTDIIPVVGGRVVARGRTDPARLRHGELVYTGALRTPVEAIVREVPFDGGHAGVSAEGFALVGDVHLWRGELRPEDYTVPAPDGRPATRDFAAERLARVICADREMLGDEEIDAIAEHVAETQVNRVAAAVNRVLDRNTSLSLAVVTGLGHRIASAAAERTGLSVLPLADSLGEDAARIAPAAAVAVMLSEWLEAGAKR